MDKIIKEELHTPVKYGCDVLVVGGGVGGIASAMAAAMTDDLPALDVSELQRKLVSYGAVLHEDALE